MESGLLSVKVFGHLGIRLGCSTDDESSSSSDSDEEGRDSGDDGSGWEGNDSDYE